MIRRLRAAAVLLLCAGAVSGAAPVNRAEHSVVRIVNFAQRGDWYSPWDVSPVFESSGSGFVIEGGLILTNAHVVSDSRLLLVYLHNDPDPHHAEILQIGHDCDLALIRPREPGVLEALPPLAIDGLPELGSTVRTLGYPAGGTRVSSTRGVVSRIEPQTYQHSGIDRHLTGQTDAAINPGNSGGPVLQEGRVVGVAFQAIPGLQSVGYFIPTEVIRRFLHDVADGRYDGYPELGLLTSSLDNPAARRRARMLAEETGVRVDLVEPAGSAQGSLREGDVLLEVEGRAVANDGTVADGDLRFPFGMLVDRRQVGESVRMRILREGARREVLVALGHYAPGDRQRNAYDRLPHYVVYGGLVFVPLELETIKTYGEDWTRRANKALLHEFLFRPLEEPELWGLGRVVLLRRLDHPVNADLAWFRYQVVERVNGRRVHRLEQLIEAIEQHEGAHHLFEFSSFRRLGVLDRREAERAHPEILERYGIAEDRRL